jgi:histidyl-tRNA synthetase
MEETLLSNLPGTRDLLPNEISSWHLVEDGARRIFAQYGFQEIRTPIFETTELFARGIGGDTDIVGKEMYTFEDQSGKSITLRPEATASVVRAYLQHTMQRGAGLTKVYYIGPMFRHEKKQRGRWRQFYQIGAEVLGSDHPALEVEVIEMILHLLKTMEVKTRLLINSVGCPNCRPGYVELLRKDLRQHLPLLCEDCRRRTETNPLRVLDCKVDGCQPYIQRLPKLTDHLCNQCAEHFRDFRGYLEEAGIGYEIVPRLVRGLDYYVRTAFEIVSGNLGAQNALVGGGRYDGLSEVLGGPPVKGFGFAMGLDRLVMILPEALSAEIAWKPEVFIAYLGEAAFKRALSIARTLRLQLRSCYIEFGGGSLKSQLRLANKLNAQHVLIIGEDELAR